MSVELFVVVSDPPVMANDPTVSLPPRAYVPPLMITVAVSDRILAAEVSKVPLPLTLTPEVASATPVEILPPETAVEPV